MKHLVRMGRILIAYCMGNPVALAIVQFQQTLEKIRYSGSEIWTMSDEAGIVQKDNRWYVWVKKYINNDEIEGKIYENSSVLDVFDTLNFVMPWLEAAERMRIVRQMRHVNCFE